MVTTEQVRGCEAELAGLLEPVAKDMKAQTWACKSDELELLMEVARDMCRTLAAAGDGVMLDGEGPQITWEDGFWVCRVRGAVFNVEQVEDAGGKYVVAAKSGA